MLLPCRLQHLFLRELMPVSKEVIITVEGFIEDAEDELAPPEKTSVTAKGILVARGGIILLNYTEDSEGGKITSSLSVREVSVRLVRSGAVISDFLFSEEVSSRSVYQIPPYSFDVEIYTKKIRSSLSTEGGEVRIFYEMNIGGAKKKARMKITVSVL